MKKHILLALLFVASLQLTAQQMLVGSYNIRYKNANDSIKGNVWQKRCQVICDQINFMAPDVFGAQEVLYGQLQDMRQALDGYDYIGIGRDDGKRAGEHEAIFYKKGKIRLLDHGDFWLSETPSASALGASFLWSSRMMDVVVVCLAEVRGQRKPNSTISTFTWTMWA